MAFGGTDVNLITGTESFPNVTQSETFTTANPDDPTQVFVAVPPASLVLMTIAVAGAALLSRKRPQ